MNIQRLIETHNTHEEPHDWSEQAKEALGQLQNALEQETTMLRQQQADIRLLEIKLVVKDAFLKSSIPLTEAEIESGLSRVKWAELLIKQLPKEHEGRNSWLLNYGEEK